MGVISGAKDAGRLSENAATQSIVSVQTGLSRSMLRHLGRSSVVAFATYGAGAGVTYLSQLIIARSTEPTSYGIYSYVLAWVTILGYFAAQGFDVSLLRLIPTYRARGMRELACDVVRYAERRSAIVSVGIMLSGCGMVELLGGSSSHELNETFFIGFATVPVLALLWIRASIVRAFGGVFTALAPDRLVRDGLLLIVISCLVLGNFGRIGAATVMIATLVSALFGLGLVSWVSRPWRSGPTAGVPASNATREWRRTALPLVSIAVAEAAINRTGVVSLGWSGFTADAGVYALVFNITSVVVLPRIAVNARFAPMVSELYTQSDQTGLQELINKAASWTLMGAAGIALPLFFLAKPILTLFGPGFETAVVPMRVLLIAQVIAASAGSQIFLMTMTGKERLAAVIVMLSASGNLVLSVPLALSFGTTGAAVANAMTLLAWNLAMAVTIYRDMGAVPGIVAIFVRWRNAPERKTRQEFNVRA